MSRGLGVCRFAKHAASAAGMPLCKLYDVRMTYDLANRLDYRAELTDS